MGRERLHFFKQYKDELSVDNPDIKTGGEFDKTMVNVVIGFYSTSGELFKISEDMVGVFIDPLDALKAGISFVEGVINEPE